MQKAYLDDVLIERFAVLIRSLGHYPVAVELRMKARSDHSFPSQKTFDRFGKKEDFARRIIDFCKRCEAYEDVAGICAPIAASRDQNEDSLSLSDHPSSPGKSGYVYLALLKVGRERRYKIGKAVLVERRANQISMQLPEDLELIHAINTDDAYGIENYWHKRFSIKNTKGEWFSLDREDITAFKRRKYM